MEKTDFQEVMFDQERYGKTKRAFEDLAEKLPEHLRAFSDEDLPCTMEFIRMITETDTAFYEYIMRMLKEQAPGWMPKEERERISEVYHDLYSRLYDDANGLRRIVLHGLPLKEVDGTVVPDTDEIERLAKEAATTEVNVEKLAEYYEEILLVRKAIDRLKAYAKKNGLPNFIEEAILTHTASGRVNQTTFERFFNGDDTSPEAFEQLAYQYFKK